MSRTYKDKPWKFKYDPYTKDMIPTEGYGYLLTKTTKTKKRKEVDTEYHWMNTPSWWTRLRMNRPQRAAGRLWERTVFYELDLEDTDPPGVGKKPHIYYW